MTTTTGLSFDSLNSVMGAATTKAESDLKAAIEKSEKETTVGAAMELQASLQRWTVMTQLQSTMIKSLGDALKGVIQKAS